MKRTITRRGFLIAGAGAMLGFSARSSAAQGAGSYVALGDSITAGSHATTPDDRYVSRYRNRASEGLGVALALDNRGIGGDTSGDLLAHLLNQQSFRNAVAGAEVVTVFIGYNDIRIPRLKYRRGEGGGPDGQAAYRATVGRFAENFSRIMSNVEALTRHATLLRTATVYYPQAREDEDLYSVPGQDSNAAVHRRYLGQINETIATVSANRGALVAPVYVRFNGLREDGSRRDPVTLGYISGDGIHPNDAGHQAVANAFADRGYASS